MKNIKTILFLLICTALQLSASQTPTTWQRIKTWAYSTPLFAGWRHSEAEKQAAREKIQELLIAREQAHDQLVTNQALSDQEKARLKKQIADLDAQIHAQKIITGQKWTRTRTAILTTGAILGTAALLPKTDANVTPAISPEKPTVPTEGTKNKEEKEVKTEPSHKPLSKIIQSNELGLLTSFKPGSQWLILRNIPNINMPPKWVPGIPQDWNYFHQTPNDFYTKTIYDKNTPPKANGLKYVWGDFKQNLLGYTIGMAGNTQINGWFEYEGEILTNE